MSTKNISNKMDELLRQSYAPDEPGAVALVVKDGTVVHRKAYGLANVELGVPLQPESVFKIASVTKQFTAVSILMLVEQGKLALDDPLEKFLPGYPTHGHKITLEHLLTHTSGIASYTNLPEWPAMLGKDFKVDEMIDQFKYKPMDFAPGTRFLYNNSAYFLAGAIIANVSGKTYEEFLQEHIFAPLGMRQTVGYTGKAIIPLRAAGYEKGADGPVNCPYLSMTQPGGAGVLSSTVDDLAKWDAALYTEALVSRASLQRAWTPYTLADGSSTHYGYGWAVETFEGHTWLEHGGGIPGYMCQVARLESERLFVAVLSNNTGSSVTPGTLAIKLALLALGKTLSEPAPVVLPEAFLERFTGVYLENDGSEGAWRLKDGKLTWGDPSDEGGLEGVMIAEDELVLKSMPLNRVRFLSDPAGKISGFEMRNPFGRVSISAVKKEG